MDIRLNLQRNLIQNAINGVIVKNDEIFKNEYLVLLMCDLTIQNASKLNPELVKKAKELKAASEKRILIRRAAINFVFCEDCPCRFKDCDNCGDNYKNCTHGN